MKVEKSHESFERIYGTCWRYYRELEHSLAETRRYVSFDERNFSAFSLEYLRIILAVCGEVDTVGKCLAQIVDPDFIVKDANILKWYYSIQCARPSHSVWDDCPEEYSLPSEGTVVMLDESIELRPWSGFGVERYEDSRGATRYRQAKGKKKLRWWSDHTKLKHRRITLENGRDTPNFVLANLGNALNSMAALYTLEKALLGAVGTLDDLEADIDDSELFAPRPRMMTPSDIDELIESLN